MKHKIQPLVSICIPTYNGATFLDEALDSVLQQTYKNIEVIISDNLSTDNTQEIIENYKKKLECHVRVVNNEKIGIGSNWNSCVRHSSGEYIKFLFQDDLLLPSCVEDMVKVIENDPSLGMVVCQKILIGNVDPEMILKNKEFFSAYKEYSKKEFLDDRNLYVHPRNKFGEPPCTLIRKSVFEEIGLFNENLRQGLDYEFWYRILKSYEIKLIDKPLVKFRIHNNQTTNNNKNKILPDSYLIPLSLLRTHQESMILCVKFRLLYKVITGYFIFLLKKKTKYRR